MMDFARKLLRKVVPRGEHSSLRLWLHADWPDGKVQVIDTFTADPVFVLAPHPDDEAIGPGGTLHRHVLAGAPVAVCVISDGRWGGYDGDGTLVGRREAESRDAARILRTRDPVFLRVTDGKISEAPDVVQRIADLIIAHKARYIYLPAMTDAHPDHWGTNRLMYSVLKLLPGHIVMPMILRGYEVWSPLIANCCVDITDIADMKWQAIEAFPSQIAVHDYTHAAKGLNHYRALPFLHGRGYAEAFMQMTPDEFKQLFRAASLRFVPEPVRPRRRTAPVA
jgi:N-acetylglucosamine malate deacetylase 1